MTNAIQIDQTDRLLDELENAARSTLPSSVLFQKLLSSLRVIVNSDSASILVSVEMNRWLQVASCGVLPPECEKSFVLHRTSEPTSESLSFSSELLSWFAVPVQTVSPSQGWILLAFSRPFPENGLLALKAICSAFAEVLEIRRLHQLERLFGSDWSQVSIIERNMAGAPTLYHASQLLVDQLLLIMKAARISLAECPAGLSKPAKLLAISGVPNWDPVASHVINLQKVATEALHTEQPIFRQTQWNATHQELNEVSNLAEASLAEASLAEDGTFKNLIAMKFAWDRNQSSTATRAIVMEWTTHDDMIESIPVMTHYLPVLSAAWLQQQRWLQVPAWARELSTWSIAGQFSRKSYSLLRIGLACFLMAVIYKILFQSSTLVIEAEAVLEPAERRSIFANVDGYLESLMVEDGQAVQKGDPIAKLRSPTLDLQIEEAVGQIRAVSEKRNGLRVAINQASASSPEALIAQSRISADILLLETQEKQMKDKLAFLTAEKQKLEIASPLAGVVVSRDIRQELESRPLRRGDSLFYIADLEGAWQLRVRVADKDTGYLMKHHSGGSGPLEFIFDSLPSERFQGEIRHIASTLDNPDGTGGYLLVLASLDRAVALKAHMGAKARVFIDCGQQPVWFVWCRPIVESIQKRVWPFAEIVE
jgi:multidrug efflux pump subunit AcrA (membrane-fusion protein)